MEDMQLQEQRLEAESKKEEQSRKQHQDLIQVMLQQTKQQQEHKQNTALKKLLRLGDYKCSNYSTVQKKCKRNPVFFVLCSREISPRNFVKALANFRSAQQNFALILLKFRIHLSERNFRFAEISSERKFAPAKFRHSEDSHLRNFARAKI